MFSNWKHSLKKDPHHFLIVWLALHDDFLLVEVFLHVLYVGPHHLNLLLALGQLFLQLQQLLHLMRQQSWKKTKLVLQKLN